MTGFLLLMIGVLLFIGLVCRLVLHFVQHDTTAYDKQFLWERFDLQGTGLPNR